LTDRAAPAIRVRDVVKRFGETMALDHLSFDAWPGSLLSLLGPSGCGKTTALRVVAGFDTPDSGLVEIEGIPMFGNGRSVPPERRRVGMVFQDYALFPHMDVAANVGYGVRRRPDAARRVAEVLDLVGMPGYENRFPHELSGGQQQRVALARALAPGPRVILLDEPFSNLDAALRDRVRRDLREILRHAGTTAVFVTHDQAEALAMSDMVAVMQHGRVIQAASPAVLYQSPATPWVAGFLGEADFVTGFARDGLVETAVGRFETGLTGRVQVMIRPESVRVSSDPQGEAVVVDREYFGHDQIVTLVVGGGTTLRARLGPAPVLDPGQRVAVEVTEAATFPAGV
jgi:iron(III) transport system ATP-binding protein